MKKIICIFCLVFFCTLCACTNNSEMNPSTTGTESTAPPQGIANSAEISDEVKAQHLLGQFFITIGTDVSRSDIDDIAKSMGLYVDYKNSGTGIYTYRIAAEKNIASTIYKEKGTCVTVSFDGLRDDALTEITYFDAEKMIAGYWSPDKGYSLADYNYPQIVYYDAATNKVFSRTPVNDAKEIVEYTFGGDVGENLLETLFSSLTSETTKSELLAFVDEHGLSYNSRGAGNEEVIAYCYEIGDKFGENGSYITFSTDSDDLITRVTYIYYPANYWGGYCANFYSESYAANHSVPSGFVLETQNNSAEYSSAKELLAQLHN